MPFTALQPVSQAVFARLNVPALKAAPPTGAGCVGGVTDNPMQGGTFPYLWYEVDEDPGSHRALGAGPSVLRVRLRLHVFSQFPGMAEAQRITATATNLVMASLLTVANFSHRAIFDYDATPLPFEELNGVKVRELVKEFELYLDQV